MLDSVSATKPVPEGIHTAIGKNLRGGGGGGGGDHCGLSIIAPHEAEIFI